MRTDTFSNVSRSLSEDSQPVQVADNLKIARKPKIEAVDGPTTESSINGTTNGTSTTDGTTATGIKRKRGTEESAADPGSAQKLRKMATASNEHGTNGINSVFIEDSTDGAIIIDED